MAAIFDVVVFGERRDHGGTASNLADAIQDYFGAAIVEFNGSMNFDGAAGQAADVADIFQSGGEDYYREWAGQLILAEVEEVNSFFSDSDF